MAARTASTLYEENVGSMKCIIATFADIDDGDTWASGIVGAKAWFFCRTDDPSTQTSAGVAVANSSGTFTFHPAEDNAAGRLVVFV